MPNKPKLHCKGLFVGYITLRQLHNKCPTSDDNLAKGSIAQGI